MKKMPIYKAKFKIYSWKPIYFYKILKFWIESMPYKYTIINLFVPLLMPGISDRRKMRSSNVFGEEDSLMRMSTNTRGFLNTAPPSHDDFRKIIRDL